MEGQSVRRKFKGAGNAAGRHSLRSGLNEQTKHVQPIFLRERSQSGDCIGIFHISMAIEISFLRQELFQ